MFTVTPLAWTYSSLVASERIQKEKQTEDKGRIQSTGEVVVSSTGNERHDGRGHHSYLRSRFNLVYLVYWCEVRNCNYKAHARSSRVVLGAAPL